jgi:hypothetical protein
MLIEFSIIDYSFHLYFYFISLVFQFLEAAFNLKDCYNNLFNFKSTRQMEKEEHGLVYIYSDKWIGGRSL